MSNINNIVNSVSYSNIVCNVCIYLYGLDSIVLREEYISVCNSFITNKTLKRIYMMYWEYNIDMKQAFVCIAICISSSDVQYYLLVVVMVI